MKYISSCFACFFPKPPAVRICPEELIQRSNELNKLQQAAIAAHSKRQLAERAAITLQAKREFAEQHAQCFYPVSDGNRGRFNVFASDSEDDDSHESDGYAECDKEDVEDVDVNKCSKEFIQSIKL